MLQLEDGRIVVGGDSMLNIINTVTYQVDLMIENDSLGTFLCIFQIGCAYPDDTQYHADCHHYSVQTAV